jgi:biopolymer transport protein ExbD
MSVHLDSSSPGEDDAAEAMSDINVTPFIDVMLVLLIIFMVTAPLMMGGVRVNLPKVSGTPMPRPDSPLIVSLDSESRVFIDKDLVDPVTAKSRFRTLALESESGEVFVRGDGEVKYAKVMDLMSDLGQAGFSRVTLVTNVQAGANPPADGQDGQEAASTDAASNGAGLADAAATGAAPSPVSEGAGPASPSLGAQPAAESPPLPPLLPPPMDPEPL